ncbi:MAG: DUF1453 domain-containing protein [Hamadaea sp.]|uniref:hypothetical protein n=1 Tax=Hamadaea sp. TaxID=2024425 RepID=UPI00179992D7|nr:hypothetical protein [Hamadaea sp.]NUR73395.1 DUF1453 domain-containing protein [Hamadaea sp.]NUT18542.1 DUF1453 domain-containing protein [Hamadaea sp.]
MNYAQILLIAALIVWTMVRRMAGQPVQSRRMLIIPLGVTVAGVAQLDAGHLATVDLAILVVQAALSIGLGLARGASVRLYLRDGVAWSRYRWLTIGLWVATIGVRVVFAVMTGALRSGAAASAMPSLLIGLGVGLLAEAALVLFRVTTSELPLAPDDRAGRTSRRQPIL